MQRNKHNVITQRHRCEGASAKFTCELWWWWGTNEAQVQNLDTNYDVKAWVKHKCKTQGWWWGVGNQPLSISDIVNKLLNKIQNY